MTVKNLRDMPLLNIDQGLTLKTTSQHILADDLAIKLRWISSHMKSMDGIGSPSFLIWWWQCLLSVFVYLSTRMTFVLSSNCWLKHVCDLPSKESSSRYHNSRSFQSQIRIYLQLLILFILETQKKMNLLEMWDERNTVLGCIHTKKKSTQI